MTDPRFIGIDTTNELEIAEALRGLQVTGLHCTNGTYMYDAEKVVPTTLAGFKYIDECVAVEGDTFLVAINSDISMKNIMDQKNASDEERVQVQGQNARTLKVIEPLMQMFPNRQIIAVFYDQSTPTNLYRTLFQEGINLESLHKWGYGTDPKAAKIEGAELFNRVLAFPTPNDIKPVCYGITAQEDQTDLIQIVKLTETLSSSGKPYINKQGKVMFDVPSVLTPHSDKYAGMVMSAPAGPKLAQ